MDSWLGLEKAVTGLSARLEAMAYPSARLGNKDLWTYLLECVLSSQVPYRSAQVAAQQVIARLFTCPEDDESTLTAALTDCLNNPMDVDGRTRRYRFPNLKARQVAGTWCRFQQERSLEHLVYADMPEPEVRNVLVGNVRGMGLKQASMLLRDVGVGRNLAIVDRHVLKYMHAVRLIEKIPDVLSPARYLKLEGILQDYAMFLGYPLATVDRAIWLITREARQEKML